MVGQDFVPWIGGQRQNQYSLAWVVMSMVRHNPRTLTLPMLVSIDFAFAHLSTGRNLERPLFNCVHILRYYTQFCEPFSKSYTFALKMLIYTKMLMCKQTVCPGSLCSKRPPSTSSVLYAELSQSKMYIVFSRLLLTELCLKNV